MKIRNLKDLFRHIQVKSRNERQLECQNKIAIRIEIVSSRLDSDEPEGKSKSMEETLSRLKKT